MWVIFWVFRMGSNLESLSTLEKEIPLNRRNSSFWFQMWFRERQEIEKYSRISRVNVKAWKMGPTKLFFHCHTINTWAKGVFLLKPPVLLDNRDSYPASLSCTGLLTVFCICIKHHPDSCHYLNYNHHH